MYSATLMLQGVKKIAVQIEQAPTFIPSHDKPPMIVTSLVIATDQGDFYINCIGSVNPCVEMDNLTK